MKKKNLILLLILCTTIGVLGYYYTNVFREIPLNNEQIKKYDIYNLTITKNTNMNDIIKLCEVVEGGYIGDVYYAKLTSLELESYLYNCKELKWIEQIRERLYITYTTKDNLGITLGYDDENLIEKNIYDREKDLYVFINEEKSVFYKNFSKA